MENEQNLNTPLQLDAGRRSNEMLVDMINAVASSPTGKAVLEQAAEAGYSVGLDYLDGCIGTCHAKDKKIVLSSSHPYEKLISSLAHEARHAVQITNGAEPYYTPNVLVQDQIIEKRLMEADAVATSIMVCHELKEKGYGEPLAEMDYLYNKEIAAFNEGMKTSKKEALTQAALAWYEKEDRMFKLEGRAIAHPLSVGENFKNTTGKYKKVTPEDCIARICTFEGENYFTQSAEALKTPERAGVSDKMKNWLDMNSNVCREEGVQPEPSVEKIPVYKLSPSHYGYVNFPPMFPEGRQKISDYKEAKAVQAHSAAKIKGGR